MHILISLLPMLLFVLLYVGSGIYFTLTGVPNGFYQVSPAVVVIPAIALGWLLYKGSAQERMSDFLDGVRHKDIITMCLIFLLAGAFSTVTKSIGCVDATVNLALSLIPAKFLLMGLFITAAFISTAIGTSLGTVATIAPIAAGLADQGAFSSVLAMGTVVGGAMFGDNLSLISDTTIAAVLSQGADPRKKLRLNIVVAGIASIITIGLLIALQSGIATVHVGDYSYMLILPYLVLIGLAMMGLHAFVVLILALTFTGIIGFWQQGYTLLAFNADILKGFGSMMEITILCLLIGGLTGLTRTKIREMATYLADQVAQKYGKRMAQLVIAKIVSVFDILLALNTVAIVVSGEIAKTIAEKNKIPPHYSAAWLDIFSCVFQGLIPYGAQILLASAIGHVSPISVMPYVFYCYLLGIVSVGYILLKRDLTD